MRYIDVSNLELPVGWEDKACAARVAVASASEEQRSKEITAKARIWGELKDALSILSIGKCWYCESREVRSDCAVDHYRPKNRVAECENHPGYWWLAFEKANYRFSCTFCNSRRKDQDNNTSGGKQDCFPIYDESMRARCEADRIEDEQPMLLDPFCPADPPLLWFDEDGKATINSNLAKSDYNKQRVVKSIELLHLNHTRIKEQRLGIVNYLKRKLANADRQYTRLERGDQGAREAVSTAIREIRDMIAPGAVYASATKCYLMGMRGTSSVADAVLGS